MAGINVMVEEGMIENAARLGPIMDGHMRRLAAKHKCVRTHRNIGLFGLIELQKNVEGERLVPYAGAHPVMGKVGKYLRDNGLFTMLQWGTIMTNPPLCITDAQMAEGFEIIDGALSLVDAELGL